MQTNTPPPARYKGPLTSLASRCVPIRGETMLNNLPQKLATPQAVPRIGAGYASGVQPYRILQPGQPLLNLPSGKRMSYALNMLWKKYSIILMPTLDASVLMVAKMNSEMPISAEEMIMPHCRPTSGTPYMRAPSITPGTPQM